MAFELKDLGKHVELKDEVPLTLHSQSELETQSQSHSQPQFQKEHISLPQSTFLIIQLLNGKPVQLALTEELRGLPIGQLKQQAFPEETSRGCRVRFIYRGRLLQDAERLMDLEFVDNAVIHAQINEQIVPSSDVESQAIAGVAPTDERVLQQNLLHPSQFQMIPQLVGTQSQQTQQISVEEPEGTSCDFWYAFCLIMLLDLVGLLVIFFCNYPKKAKKGAILAFIIRCLINLLLYTSEEDSSKEY